MAQVRDPVCNMMVESTTAPAQVEFRGQTYYFCSTQCERQFEANPERYAGRTPGTERDSEQRPPA